MFRLVMCLGLAICLVSSSSVRGQEPATIPPTSVTTTTVPVAQPPVQPLPPAQGPDLFRPAERIRVYSGPDSGQQEAVWVDRNSARDFYRSPSSTTNSNMPYLVLHSELPVEERKQLTEDLQIFSSLMVKAVGESGTTEFEDSALGLAVTRNQPSGSHAIEYQQDVGVIMRFSTNRSVCRPVAATSVDPNDVAAKKESAWDAARRDLFESQERFNPTPVRAGFDWSGRTQVSRPKYDDDQMMLLEKRVREVLSNVDRIHFPVPFLKDGTPHTISIVLRSLADGSVMTFRTSVVRNNQGALDVAPVTTHQYFDRPALTIGNSYNTDAYSPAAEFPQFQTDDVAPAYPSPPAAVAPVRSIEGVEAVPPARP